ncbi:uncharacterized protein V1510DRAFT_361657 [Dipodascopsis tothii]|uniref:uncharacterized protein n=1 Tax=Dipodascopsis tothii TaxID=44089 RepID=UPI0034CEB3C8
MSFGLFLAEVNGAIHAHDPALGALLAIRGGELGRFARDARAVAGAEAEIARAIKDKTKTWPELVRLCWRAAAVCAAGAALGARYDAVAAVAQEANRLLSKHDRWLLPLLYMALRELLAAAAAADAAAAAAGAPADRLSEAARIINRSVTVCLNDRSADLERSRKWGVYYVISVLFKVYFRLGTLSLATSLLRVLHTSAAEMPPLDAYPKADQTTFRFYVGVLAFMDEDYDRADDNLSRALDTCHRAARRNQELVLTYLLPLRLLRARAYPSKAVWATFPQLAYLYRALFISARRGDIRTFEAALAEREHALVRRRLYITVTKIRNTIARPRLFEQVYLALGRATRIPVSAFRRGLEFVGVDVADDQVECWLAVAIYQGNMKGYISRERNMVVLSSTDAFPRRARA